jgi:multicomponent Na+:H+ antiporter subunit F
MTFAPDTILELALRASYALLAFGIACAFTRLVRGPSLPDRVVALDYTAILTVGFAALYAITADEPAFIDVSVVLALAAFLATVAFARFAERREGAARARARGHGDAR